MYNMNNAGIIPYLPRLKRLPKVNNAANFRDLSTITGVNARAYMANIQ